MFDAVMVGCGVFWTLTYLLIIRQGFRDETYGMPLAALCANLSWELVFSFVYPHDPLQRSVNVVWLLFDGVILSQVLRYGPREFPALPARLFYYLFALALVTGFGAVLTVTLEFDDFDAAYSAFGSNFMMSALFVAMLISRGSLRGQSVAIAVCKMLGTALASLAFFFFYEGYGGSVLLPSLYVAIFVIDATYVGMVVGYARRGRKAGGGGIIR